jgi:glycosyltransferase involved in cell wall biosynthesis
MGERILKISVVIPVYNEAGTIREILKRIQAVDIVNEIIIVDDSSNDGTLQYLHEYGQSHPDVTILFHEKNVGKGAALRTGFAQVSGDVVIIQDADLEYDPREYPNLLLPILDGRADVVFGSRFLGGPHRVLYFWHYLGNRLLTLLSNVLNNLNLTDVEVCYKVFKVSVLQNITFRSNRFAFDPEFTAKVAKKGFRIYEVPISYSGRSYAEGKKITWKDGVKAVFSIIWFRFF